MKSKLALVAMLAAGLSLTAAPAQAYWHHHHHHGGGGAIAGFAAGAILGGALAASQPDYYYGPPVYAYEPGYGPPSVAWCEHHYRSYDPRTGTYLGYDGYRHPCP
jgi:BA14K-like protein